MKLTNAEILDLNAGLAEFDMRVRPVKNEKGETIGQERELPYKIAFKATYAIARSRDALKPHLAAIEKTKGDIIARLTDGKNFIKPDDPNFSDCMKEIEALMAMQVDVELHRFMVTDLNPAPTDAHPDEWNRYSPSTIQRILPCLMSETVPT